MAALFFLFVSIGTAQVPTAGSAHVNLYFPHLADGGAPAYKFQTSMTFLNASSSATAHISLELVTDSGTPLTLNFGQGPVSSMTFTVAPGGIKTITSNASSPTLLSGWAAAFSDQPVQGSLQFRAIINGTPQQAVTALATLPSLAYASPATALTGVALANIYNTPQSFQISVFDETGAQVGSTNLTVPGLGHQAFNLNSLFPRLATTFSGSLKLVGVVPGTYLIGWALGVDNSGVLSSYPPGGQEWPISHIDRIQDVYMRCLSGAQAAADSAGLGLQVNKANTPLKILFDPWLNAFAIKADNSINIEVAVSELISDSPSELAFLIAHELGHALQYRTNKLFFYGTNAEWDADIWGMLISLSAGYDPYAAAGTLGKLAMASGDASLFKQFQDYIGSDPHGSFLTRIDNIFSLLRTACSTPALSALCGQYKSTIHPHLPGSAPLIQRPEPVISLPNLRP